MNILQRILHKIYTPKYYTVGFKSNVVYPHKILNTLKDPSKVMIGDHTILKCEIQILGHGGKVFIGDYCFIGENTYLWSGDSIEIGNRVLIGHGCNIFDNDIHPLDAELRHKQYVHILEYGHPKEIDLKDQKVIIEDDVWLGANVTVLKGVTIGRGAVIGANSIVSKDIEPRTVNAGIPVQLLRRLDDDK